MLSVPKIMILSCLISLRVGPLVTGLNYHVRIEKPGYILTPEENPFNFNAYKLAEVQVLVCS